MRLLWALVGIPVLISLLILFGAGLTQSKPVERKIKED
jgi:hypothetical protein